MTTFDVAAAVARALEPTADERTVEAVTAHLLERNTAETLGTLSIHDFAVFAQMARDFVQGNVKLDTTLLKHEWEQQVPTATMYGTGHHFPDGEYQIYLDRGHGRTVLLVEPDGTISTTVYDGPTTRECIEVHGTTTDLGEAHKIVRQAYLMHMLQQQCYGLQAYLDEHVPDGVAHYAVEGLRSALAEMTRKASTVAFNYGKEVVTTPSA